MTFAFDAGPAGPGRAYLEHLRDDDLLVLLQAATHGRAVPGDVDRVRARPEAVEPLLAHPTAYDAVFHPDDGGDPFLGASPFLAFAVAVHRALAELRDSPVVPEWVGPRRRVPILDARDLRDFLADPWRRLFLVELLASYTHVASGVVWVQTRRGWRRRRYSELDLVRLASLLDLVPEADRPGVYRRMGDLALFLTGVFPDHTATHGLRPLDEGRLLRAARTEVAGGGGPLGTSGTVGLLEQLGERWYRLACATVARPVPAALRVVGDVAARFGEARRTLNLLTDRYLFPFRSAWFDAPAA
jgi:hypothetical protein